MKEKISGGTIRQSGDGSGGGAITTGAGKGTEDNPHVHATTSFDNEGNTSNSHTTVESDGKSVRIDKD